MNTINVGYESPIRIRVESILGQAEISSRRGTRNTGRPAPSKNLRNLRNSEFAEFTDLEQQILMR
jgi:hypothetical protein